MRTLGDLIRLVRAYAGNDAATHKAAACRAAAFAAQRQIQTYAEWAYYKTWGRIVTSPQYLTGTIAYDHTGGAFERVVTLTGGTWPDWAAKGCLILGTVLYDVATRESGTQITLTAETNPGQDVASGASFTLVRIVYPVPDDAVGIDQLVDAEANSPLKPCDVRDFVLSRANRAGPSRPMEYAVFGSQSRNGKMEAYLNPPPDEAYQLEFLYRRYPAIPVLEDESAGKVSMTGNAVTGHNTRFSSAHVGCVLRLSADGTPVTGDDGVNPPAFETVVTAVASATSLTTEDAIPAAAANVAYSLSGAIDVQDGPMWDFLVQIAYKEFRIRQRVNMTNEELDGYNRAKAAALAADRQRTTARRIAGGPRLPYRYNVSTARVTP